MLRFLYSRCRVPSSLEAVTTVRPDAEIDPLEVGVEPRAVEHIWSAVRSLYASGVHPAMALCVRRKGKVLIDRAIGHAAGNGPDDAEDEPKVQATPDTPFSLLSASKAVTAMVLHLLDERHQLDLDDPVCEFIPRFARHGKDSITLRHILTHRAGVPNPPLGFMDLDLLERPHEIVDILCDQRPLWRPGKQLAYHAVTTGFLLGEVVQAVTGRSIRDVLRDEILSPLGFRWTNYGVAAEDISRVAVNAYTGPPAPWPVGSIIERALGLPLRDVVAASNDPRFLRAVFPSANVVSTAEELSRFFELLRCGGELDGVRIFDPRTIRRATAEQSYLEMDFTLVLPFRYGMGFMLGAEWFSLYGPFTARAYGHIGFTNVIAWADPERQVSAALVSSGKPLVYPEVFYLFEMCRRIGAACPRDG